MKPKLVCTCSERPAAEMTWQPNHATGPNDRMGRPDNTQLGMRRNSHQPRALYLFSWFVSRGKKDLARSHQYNAVQQVHSCHNMFIRRLAPPLGHPATLLPISRPLSETVLYFGYQGNRNDRRVYTRHVVKNGNRDTRHV